MWTGIGMSVFSKFCRQSWLCVVWWMLSFCLWPELDVEQTGFKNPGVFKKSLTHWVFLGFGFYHWIFWTSRKKYVK